MAKKTAGRRKSAAKKTAGARKTARKTGARKTARKKTAGTRKTARKRSSSSKRTLLKNAAGTFFAKRKRSGRFSELDERTRSLRADRARKAKTKVKKGYRDQGD